MKWNRVNAILIRNLYLYKRSLPRLMDILYWPVMELLVWGFLSIYLQKLQFTAVNMVTVLLGGVVFWDLLTRSQEAISVAFLEEVWEKNFLNIFVTPLTVSEMLAAFFLIGVVRIFMVGVVAALLAFLLYHFNIFLFGFYLIPFIINLLIFGWAAGIFIIAIIFRYGTSAQILAFGLVFLLQPFAAVFYPVSALPLWAQTISKILPPSYVFEGMRAVIATETLPTQTLILAFGTNLIYLGAALWLFYAMFKKVKEKGLLLKLN